MSQMRDLDICGRLRSTRPSPGCLSLHRSLRPEKRRLRAQWLPNAQVFAFRLLRGRVKEQMKFGAVNLPSPFLGYLMKISNKMEKWSGEDYRRATREIEAKTK